ncbi:MAG: rhodanese-like domain-containing protein [Bacteroidetes bacterium]|nr:rhodanese-like domain-containing protein [Bacteroidota bacterium]MCW5894945.1 rhodanese-like domain-containing protein [Bacteroidota bacterium]
MKAIFSHLSFNQKLAIVAGVLGFLAIFAGSPYTSNTATMNVKELALLVEKEVDHVTVDELADWIIQGKADYRLMDLRNEKEFNEYHIPTAENIPVGSLIDAGLTRNEKIILYSEGGIHSAQAWFLLKAKQYKAVYMLRDGLAEWKDRILFPSLAENASAEEKAAFEKRKAVSMFFGGSPQTGTGRAQATPQLAMPKLEMPAGSAAPAGTAKKKKKEGC